MYVVTRIFICILPEAQLEVQVAICNCFSAAYILYIYTYTHNILLQPYESARSFVHKFMAGCKLHEINCAFFFTHS